MKKNTVPFRSPLKIVKGGSSQKIVWERIFDEDGVPTVELDELDDLVTGEFPPEEDFERLLAHGVRTGRISPEQAERTRKRVIYQTQRLVGVA